MRKRTKRKPQQRILSTTSSLLESVVAKGPTGKINTCVQPSQTGENRMSENKHIDGIKVLTIGKSWQLPHETKHVESTAYIEESLATFRPDVIVTSTWIPGILQGASFEIRKRWINVNPKASDDAVATAIDNCYRNNLWMESPYAKDHPLISIFTPTYNTGDYLRTAFQSLRDQTYPTWEWVIVDDHSTDKTWDRLQEFAAEDIRVRPYRAGFRHSKIGETKGLATNLCRGVYLVEFDHDDYLHETALMEIKKAFDLRPDVGFIYSNHASFYENGAPQKFDASPWDVPGRYQEVEYKGKKFLETRGPDIYDRFSPDFRHQFGWFLTVGPHHVKAFRSKTFWELGGYHPGLPVADDWDIMARFFLRSKCLHLDKLLYFYRYRDAFGNATFSRNKSIQDHLALGREHYAAEFNALNQRRLAEGEKNGLGPWHDACNEITERESVPSQGPRNQKQPIPISPPPGTQAPPWKSVVSFIILDATGSDNSVECIKSIRKFANVEHEVILIGNGVDSKAEAIASVDRYEKTEANLGYAAGCNLGASLSGGNFLCFVNDDAAFVDDVTIPKLLEKAKNGFVAGPYSNRAKPPQGNHEKAIAEDIHPQMIVGLTMMVSSGIYRLAGGFDPRLLTWEDDDLCLKLSRQGCKPVIVGGTWVNHKGHQTFEALGLDHVKVESENKLKYERMNPDIKVIVIAKNEESCIIDFFRQFEPITKQWYLLDTGSNDKTIELARSIGVTVESREFTDFADMRNKALEIFDGDRPYDGHLGSWVIMMDPDERLDRETIMAIPNLLWSQGDKYATFHSRLIAVYPSGEQKEFVAKPFIFRNDGVGTWKFKVHEKWITTEPYALVTTAVNSHVIEYHDKKKRNNAEDFYSKLMAAEPYFTDPEYKAKMRSDYPILDYDRMDDPRIEKMAAGPLISVVIPTFKRRELLSKAIWSALNQSWKTLEVVVVGDNCPDLNEFVNLPRTSTYDQTWMSSGRVRVINLKENHGAGGAIPRNVGIQIAASDWIAYLDDDNEWNRDHIERLFGTILKEHTVWGWSSMSVNGVDMKFDKLEKGKIDTSCVIHHRSLISKHGPWKNRTDANYWHDFELFSRWAQEPQTVTKYPSVVYNAATSGQAQFLAQLTSSEKSRNIAYTPEAEIPKDACILAIGVLGLTSRDEMRKKLLDELNAQVLKLPYVGSASVLVNVDNGTKSIGQKRQEVAIEASTRGFKYICFVDDDDWVPEKYVESLLKATVGSPDCITFRGEVQQPGKMPEPVRYSLNYPIRIWCKDAGGTHMRTPNHLCPVKTEIMSRVPFKAVDYEDALWSLHVYPHLKSQCHIDEVLYYYRYNPEVSEATKKTPKLIPGLFFNRHEDGNNFVDGNGRVFTYDKAIETLNDLFGTSGPQAKQFIDRVMQEDAKNVADKMIAREKEEREIKERALIQAGLDAMDKSSPSGRSEYEVIQERMKFVDGDGERTNCFVPHYKDTTCPECGPTTVYPFRAKEVPDDKKEPIVITNSYLEEVKLKFFYENQHIVILAPSYGRSEYAARMLPTTILTANKPDEVTILVGVEPEQYEEYEKVFTPHKKLGIMVKKLDKGGCYVAAIREMAEYAQNFYCNQAILCFSGDDVEYQTRGWDQMVRKAFSLLPNRIGIVGGDDGINGSNFCAAPFVSPEWLDVVGVNPGNYKGMFNDAELDDIAKKAGVRVYLPDVKTIHHHYVNGTMEKDATHEHEASSWESGKAEFESRESARVDLAKKIIEASKKKG